MEEKIRVHITGFLNFEKITELPLTASSTSRFPEPCLRPEPYAGAATWPPHASHLSSKPLPRPWYCPNPPSPAPLSSPRAPVPLLLATMLPWPSHTPRLAAPSPAAPTPVDHFPARPDPPPLHRAPIKRAIALPSRAQEGRPCHCRRQARLTVEPHPPPLLGSNRAPERVPLTALHLTGQAPPPFPRRSGATAATNHRRPPAPVEPPPRVAPAPTQGTLR